MGEVARAADRDGETGGQAVLVLAPGVSTAETAACADRLATSDAALVVALRRQPGDWRAARGDHLPPTWFVTTDPHSDSVRAVADPGDLTGIGIAISEFLGWLPSNTRPAVCVDSLTTLLQYADTERTARFLQVLSGRVLAADGTVHCHADPAAHDDDVLDKLATLFDDVVVLDSA